MLVVNRSNERKNKFRKKVANGDISSLENYYECVMFGLQGQPKVEFSVDSTRGASLHDLNLGELRDMMLNLMGRKLTLAKCIKLKNAPFIRRIVHLHIGEVPGPSDITRRDNVGGSKAFLQGLGMTDVHCVRVDREIDEQGYLPYKLLTVPYSKAAELVPEAVRPASTASAASAEGTPEAATEAVAASSATTAWDAEEQKAADDLSQYVLTPAQLHLWNYPVPPVLPVPPVPAVRTPVAEEDAGSSTVRVGDKRSSDGEAADGSDGAKRARVETANSSRALARGSAVDCLPATHSEALQLLESVGLPTGAAAEGSAPLAVQYSTLSRRDASQQAALWAGVSAVSEAPRAVLVASVDCEMCETAVGVELTRVSLLAHDGSLLLDTLVRPAAEIVDYRTQYSGISEQMLSGVTTTLAQVQAAILRLVSAETILVGHSLDADLRALRLSHARCVDTALLYPHVRGFPFRMKLRKLAEDYLKLRIQTNTTKGHDSTEDARAALQLALLKAANGPLFGVSKPDRQRCPVLDAVDVQATSAALIWQQRGPERAETEAVTSVAVVDPEAGTAAVVTTAIVQGEAEVVAVEAISAVSTSGTAVAAAAAAVVEENAVGVPAVAPESYVGGNATCRHAPSAEAVVDALCAEIAATTAQGADTTFQVVTTDDKSAGPVSSWVQAAQPGAAGAAGVESVAVQKCSYLLGHISHPAAAAGADGAFVAEVKGYLERIREACRDASKGSESAGSALILVTAQDTLQPVLALMTRKRALSKNTMATAMWGAADELRLREMKKHNLAYLAVDIC